jgi:hypothetical protein
LEVVSIVATLTKGTFVPWITVALSTLGLTMSVAVWLRVKTISVHLSWLELRHNERVNRAAEYDAARP